MAGNRFDGIWGSDGVYGCGMGPVGYPIYQERDSHADRGRRASVANDRLRQSDPLLGRPAAFL